jgi:hypothetical protein
MELYVSNILADGPKFKHKGLIIWKIKVFPVHAMKAWGGAEVQLRLFFTCDLYGIE